MRTVTLSFTVGHTQVNGDDIKLLGNLSWASLGFLVVVEQTMNAADILE